MSGLDPNAGGALVVPGGSGSLPAATGAGQLPVSDAAGTAYTATARSAVVGGGLVSLLTGSPAGTAVVSDGAGDIANTSAEVSAALAASTAAAALAALGGETALPRLAVASALHHWRCDESASPFADLGSSPVSLAYVAGTREYARAGVYARYGATMQRSTAATDLADAIVSDIPSGTDFTFGVTVANETRLTSPPVLGVVAALNNGLASGSDYGVYVLTDNSGLVYISAHHAAVTADSSHVAIDWSCPHRLDVTYATATRTATLYVDGLSSATATPASGTMAALTHCSLGGLVTSLGVAGSSLMMADFTVHLSVLSASTLLSRADVCRRLAGG